MKREKKRRKKRSAKGIRVFFLLLIALIFLAIALAIAAVGWGYVTNRDFKEVFYCVSTLKTNNKIRVVQISDLHNCEYGDNNADIIQRIGKLKPDLIIYTGDCVDSTAESEDNVVSLCEALAKVAPSYYVYGNNEVERYYDTVLTQQALDAKFGFTDDNRDPQKLLEATDPLTEKLEAVGVRVLKNEMATVTVGSTTVDVYGVLTSNPSAFWSYAGATFDEYLYSNENHVKITAIHEPIVFETYTPNTWGDLMLAGHTHGGNAQIPLLGPAYTHEGGVLPGRKGCYVYGRYEVQGRPLIVSSGLENTSLYRINNKPEVVIVDINKF